MLVLVLIMLMFGHATDLAETEVRSEPMTHHLQHIGLTDASLSFTTGLLLL